MHHHHQPGALTKAETKAHTDAVAAFIAKHKEPVLTDSLATGTETAKASK